MRIGQRLLFVVIVVTCFVLLGPVGVGTNSLIGQEVRFASSPLIASITFAKTIGHEPSRSDDKSKQEVRRAYEQIEEAIKLKDAGALNRHLSQDFVMTGRFGGRSGKSKFITAITAPQVEEVEVHVKDLVVQIHDCVAIVTTDEIIDGTFIATGFDNLTRGTRVFIKEKGEWKLVSMQFTMAVKAAK